ncbi:MAG: histidine kinase dimerization/phospho-acceptor domain-containing protein [Tsuneonella sp.]
MHFDDRLATVLRHRAAGERAAKTQFRQLLDLLGNRRHGRDESLLAAAWLRLGALGEGIPPADRAAMIREPSFRFRNPELAMHLAEDEPEVAAAALAVARLDPDEWEALIPRLPIRARGFLRLRRDLPDRALAVLERLGVRDRGLPGPGPGASAPAEAEIAPRPPVPPPRPRPRPANDAGDLPTPPEDSAIGALVRRIEAFRKTRGEPGEDVPQLPLGEAREAERPALAAFAFTTDAEGRIDWAEQGAAPMVVGAALAPLRSSSRGHRQPLRGVAVELSGAPAIAGDWTLDAAPRFTEPGGHFHGYAGKFRRRHLATAAAPPPDTNGERIRQLLHELRTPVNAIQGFAEVIQQQLFGPTPHEYRALAASIAGDAARMLAGFDELDRLAKLESGALTPDRGEADFGSIAAGIVNQLQDVLRPRTSAFETDFPACPARAPLARGEAEALAWRLLATLTGAVGAGETLRLELTAGEGPLRLRCELPASLAAKSEIFAAGGKAGGAVTAGMFGPGFALRLARAEARAAGGNLVREDDWLVLTLPLLTAAEAKPSRRVSEA